MLFLQIVWPDGTICKFRAGGPVEVELVNLIVEEVMKLGVAFKPSNHVRQDIEQGIKAGLLKFKTSSYDIELSHK